MAMDIWKTPPYTRAISSVYHMSTANKTMDILKTWL